MNAGKIVLFNFPQTDLEEGKLRPALFIAKLPGNYNDWLICMISSRVHQYKNKYDELILKDSEELKISRLKSESITRSTRLAIVNEKILLVLIENISNQLLNNIRVNLSNWIKQLE